ncbi:MAG: hypothetical protein HY832_00820 [Candidatus Aenigmarchaeota archaeon]|nr:hypothetical protein [Candidatus Aenigmarchaeota archaeon]
MKKINIILVTTFVLVFIWFVSPIFAYSSGNFSANDTVVDAGGGNTSSTNYNVVNVLGETGIGGAASSLFGAVFGVQSYTGLRLTLVQGEGEHVGTRGLQSINVTFHAFDVDNNTNLPNAAGVIWVERSSGVYDNGTSCTTDSNGNCTVSFDPDCTYTGGLRKFKGGIKNTVGYYDTNSSEGTLVIDATAYCDRAITVILELNISGTANDQGYVDTQGVGFYHKADVTNHYLCVEDASLTNTPTFGLVFSGSNLLSLNLTTTPAYHMELTQYEQDNRFLIAATKGSCTTIRDRMSLIQTFSFLTQPFASFATQHFYPVQLIVSYPFVDLVGDFDKSGIFTFIVTKNETNQNQLVIEGV